MFTPNVFIHINPYNYIYSLLRSISVSYLYYWHSLHAWSYWSSRLTQPIHFEHCVLELFVVTKCWPLMSLEWYFHTALPMASVNPTVHITNVIRHRISCPIMFISCTCSNQLMPRSHIQESDDEVCSMALNWCEIFIRCELAENVVNFMRRQVFKRAIRQHNGITKNEWECDLNTQGKCQEPT